MSKSSLALSNLRAFVILLVVAFHSVLAYLGSQPASPPPFDSPPYWWRAIPIIDSERWFGFDLFCAFTYLYMMQLMFFLSGLFVWPSFLRKGGKLFLYDRFLRLGVPFLLGVFLLMPVALYPVYRFTAVDPSWSAFRAHWIALPFWPSGPLWFLWYLLALNSAAALLYRFAPRLGVVLGRISAKAGAYPGRYFIALVGVSALAYIPSAAVFKPWDWVQFGPFAFQPSFALVYVVYFFAGLGVGAYGLEQGLLGSDGMLARRWAVWVGGTLAAFLLWIIPTALTVNGQVTTVPGLEIVADLGLVLCCAAACLGWAAIFLRFTATRRPVIDSLSENAYGIYLVHYLFITWLQYILLGVALFAIAKAAIVFTGTLILSWATTIAMCRVPIGARLVGANRRMGSGPGPHTNASAMPQ
jgi:glucans biosynthesis protein C